MIITVAPSGFIFFGMLQQSLTGKIRKKNMVVPPGDCAGTELLFQVGKWSTIKNA